MKQLKQDQYHQLLFEKVNTGEDDGSVMMMMRMMMMMMMITSQTLDR